MYWVHSSRNPEISQTRLNVAWLLLSQIASSISSFIEVSKEMATKHNDAVSAVDNSDEDVFENTKNQKRKIWDEPTLGWTKRKSSLTPKNVSLNRFDDANISHDVELKINAKVWKKPLKTYSRSRHYGSSCESGVSCTGSPNQPETILKPKRPKGK